MLFEVISGINAWTESAEDIPDFITRQKSFEIAEKQLREETFDMLTYAMIFNNCMYNICYVSFIFVFIYRRICNVLI